jgi:hypothetical protein
VQPLFAGLIAIVLFFRTIYSEFSRLKKGGRRSILRVWLLVSPEFKDRPCTRRRKMRTRKMHAGSWNGDIQASANSILWLGSSLLSAARRLYEVHLEKAMMRLSPTHFH